MRADAKATAVAVGKDVFRVLHLLAVNLKQEGNGSKDLVSQMVVLKVA